METTAPVLASNLFMDRFGEVVLTLNSDGLSWKPVGFQDWNSSSCLGFKLTPPVETEIKFSDVYAVENINWGLVHKLIPNTGGLLSDSHSQMHRFVVHGYHKTRTQQSHWVLASYTFGHNDLQTCQLWVDAINAYISKEVGRPKSLLVFVHPLSGRGNGRRTWENVQPIFSRAKIKTRVTVTQRAGHARDMITSITNRELSSFDGILAVGGDGFFNEILNGLLSTRHKVPYPPAPNEFMHSVGINHQNRQFQNNCDCDTKGYACEFAETSERNEDEPLLTSAESIVPGFTNFNEDSSLSFPNNWFRLGIIPAGSTDSIVMSTTGARDPVTSALHIVLGKRTRIDLAQVVSWKTGSSSINAPSVRYAASFAGYGFYGDVITESEKYRWMGPKRYDYAGTKVFLRHRSYEADITFLECKRPNAFAVTGSEDTDIKPKEVSRQNPQKTICCVNCTICNESTEPALVPVNGHYGSASLNQENLKWLQSKGRFHSVGAAVISCRNERAPDGLVADAHLADGLMDLILIKECPRPLYLWHLAQLTRRGSNPLKFDFVEHHKTTAFTFVASNDESVWNLDGELFQASQLSAQVFRGLVSLFASGPEE